MLIILIVINKVFQVSLQSNNSPEGTAGAFKQLILCNI